MVEASVFEMTGPILITRVRPVKRHNVLLIISNLLFEATTQNLLFFTHLCKIVQNILFDRLVSKHYKRPQKRLRLFIT